MNEQSTHKFDDPVLQAKHDKCVAAFEAFIEKRTTMKEENEPHQYFDVDLECMFITFKAGALFMLNELVSLKNKQ